jgi:hypothetical protein
MSTQQFIDRLKEEAARRGPALTRLGIVKEVDTGNYTCTVAVEGEPDYQDVRLFATEIDGPQGFIIVPEQDSEVVIAQLERTPAVNFVVQTSAIEEVRIVFEEGKSAILKADGSFELKFDSLALGNQALEPAVLGDKLETLLKNFFQQTYDTHTHSTALGPSGPPQPLSTAQVSNLSSIKSQKTELE